MSPYIVRENNLHNDEAARSPAVPMGERRDLAPRAFRLLADV